MADSSLFRVIVIVFSVLFFIAAMVVNALAGMGKGLFHSPIGNVSARYETLITPAGWTFSIWGLIYTWLAVAIIYISTFLCRGYWALCLLPYVFYGNWFASMLMNMIWLLLFDRGMMGSALFVCIMLTVANYSTVFFCCYATNYYGLWLQKYYPKDLVCLRIVVQNGLALYATWTSIATLINFTIVLQLWGVEKSTAATASLCVLFVELVVWFILENCLLDRWVRYILTVYPVAILALAGNVARHYHPADPTPNSVFMVILLLLACVLLVVRIIVVIWRRRKQSLYFSANQPMTMLSPCDGGKRKIFK